jgi:cell division protein FtsN
MTVGSARQRRSGTMGTPRWIALGVIALVILGLTFTLGALVGRQWARHSQPTMLADHARKAAPVPRRSGLSEVALEQPPAQEQLTFYKTLTAPLETTRFPVKPDASVSKSDAQPKSDALAKSEPAAKVDTPAKAVASPKTQAVPVTTVAATDRMPRAEERPLPSSSSAKPADQPDRATRSHGASPEWTVQVGVYGNVQQAVDAKKGLDQKGIGAQVVPTLSGGQVRYRVRVGTFHSREEALREAERMQSERSLRTFVTAK